MSASTPPGGTPGRIARRPDTGSFTSVATLLPPPPPPPSSALVPAGAGGSVAPGRFAGFGGSDDQRRILLVVLAAATVLALVATVGMSVLWAGNRKLAAEVEAASAQAVAAGDRAAELQTVVDAMPTTETVDGLAGRLQGVEDWTGLPSDGSGGSADLQTRLLEVSRGMDGLETDLRDGLGSVRSEVASVRGELTADEESVSPAELDAIRRDLGALRTAVDDVRQDVGVLCWALSMRQDVAATC
jgi:hypothetical protein